MGKENVREIQAIMGGEDMAYYLQKVPGTFFGLGGSTPARAPTTHHHPKFNVTRTSAHWRGG